MNWFRRLFGREPGERERKAEQVARLGEKSDATLTALSDVLSERDEQRERVRAATRGAVKAVQRTHR